MLLKSFIINDYITLHLVQDHSDRSAKTVIFFKDYHFRQCKRLLLEIPVNKSSEFDKINSIDDIIINNNLQQKYVHETDILPEEEFWAHCSNLQAWVEHDYDTKILDSALSFPLLKELYEEGDPIAKKIFKEEIANRFLCDNPVVSTYLAKEGFLDVFSNEEFWQLISIDLIDEDEKFALKEILNLSFRRFYPKNKIPVKYLDIPYFEIKGGRIIKFKLNQCGLRILPKSIRSFKYLKELNLSLNNIFELPITVGLLESLEILNIRLNPIHKLPESIKNLKKLKEVITTEVLTEEILDKIKEIKK